MTLATDTDVRANRDGRLSDAQRARFRRSHLAPARARVLFSALGLVIGATLFGGRGEALGFALVVSAVALVALYASWTTMRDIQRDLADGRLATSTVKLTPFSRAELAAERHWIGVPGGKIHFGAISLGMEREWFARGGTFRLHYLPRSRQLVLYEHVAEPS